MTTSSAGYQQDFNLRSSDFAAAVKPVDLMCLYFVTTQVSDNDEVVQHALAIAARAAVKFNDKQLAIDAGGLGSMSKLLMVEEL